MTLERARELMSSQSLWPIHYRITEAERAWLWSRLKDAPPDRTIQDELSDFIAGASMARAA